MSRLLRRGETKLQKAGILKYWRRLLITTGCGSPSVVAEIMRLGGSPHYGSRPTNDQTKSHTHAMRHKSRIHNQSTIHMMPTSISHLCKFAAVVGILVCCSTQAMPVVPVQQTEKVPALLTPLHSKRQTLYQCWDLVLGHSPLARNFFEPTFRTRLNGPSRSNRRMNRSKNESSFRMACLTCTCRVVVAPLG